MNKCERCGFMHYRTDPCRGPNKSAAARKDVQVRVEGGSLVHKGETQSNDDSVAQRRERPSEGGMSGVRIPPIAGTQALPADTDIRKPGRPRTGFDKLAYNRQYMREYRAKLKAQKEMGK